MLIMILKETIQVKCDKCDVVFPLKSMQNESLWSGWDTLIGARINGWIIDIDENFALCPLHNEKINENKD